MTRGTHERTAQAEATPPCSDPPHRRELTPPPHVRGKCKKCGATRQYNDVKFDTFNMVAHVLPPAIDARDRVLLFIREHEGVRLDWDGFKVAVGCGYATLGDMMKTLLSEGVIVEVEEMTYALVEPDSG